MRDDEELKTAFPEPEGHKLINRAGIGRRSQWFQARQLRLDRPVALKYLRPALARSEIFASLFFDAGRQAATIVHPAALPIINIYPAQHCLSVQWCNGSPMQNLYGTLDVHRAARVGEVTMDCLSSLHATGRCHGNLAPGNIFLDADGGVWLDDFFQPPAMRDGDRVFVRDQAFLAPEFVRDGTLDWRTDVFTLGCVLDAVWERTGRSPEFAGLVESMRAIDPARRGASPASVQAALTAIRRMEESRLGMSSTRMRRRRRYRRVPTEFEVSLRKRSATPEETVVILNKIRDIGESGVFVETDDEMLGIGSILELDFGLRGVEGNVHAFGIVRWRSAPPLPRGVGVQFVEVDQAGLLRLRQFLDGK